MRVFVVCTNPETGEYIAFDSEMPLNKVTAYSREAAVYAFVTTFACSLIQFIEQGPEQGS